MSKSIIINGYTFRLTAALGVAVVGPGLPSNGGFGIQITGDVDNLSLRILQGLASIPGVSPEAAAVIASFTQADVQAIKALAIPTPPPPEPPVVTSPAPPTDDPAARPAGSPQPEPTPKTAALPAPAAPPTAAAADAVSSPSVVVNPVPGGAPPPPATVNAGNNLANEDNPQASNRGLTAAGPSTAATAADQNQTPTTGDFARADRGQVGSANSTTATVSGTLNAGTRPQIIPQSNILDTFSSYTYRLSVYLMTPQQYTEFIKSNKKTVNGYNLLFQSGGAPTNVGGFQGALSAAFAATQADLESEGIGFQPTVNTPGGAQPDAGRNPAFPLDFYIESCTVVNQMQGQATGTAHSVDSLKFTVIEPVGITLLDRMYEAVQDAAPRNSAGAINYQNAQYLMIVRWYGYDANGNIVGGSPSNSDPRAVVEKYIPFTIKTINWRVSSKATEYEFDCVPVGQLVASGTRRGVIPFDIQLSQGTVGTILGGELAYVDRPPTAADPGAATTPTTGDFARADRGQTTVTAPAKANAAATPKRTVKQGLMAAMNEFAKNLTQGQNPVYEFADQYEIVFAPGAEAIRDASIVLPDRRKEARSSAITAPATSNPQSLNPDTQSKDTSVASKSIFAGQSIVQVIDQVIRNSSYITSQALTRYDGDKEVSNDDVMKKTKPVDWFRINFEAVPIGSTPDSRRNDYAYKIRYIITAYKIDNYDSKYFPLGSFRGVHKSYPYWFTGKNTAVLDYSETLNNAYNMLVSGSDPTNSAAERERRKVASTMRELINYTYGPASGETRQGTRGKGNEIGANLADSLYGGADLANTKLQIIGDPAWIQQGSLVGGIKAELFNPTSFLPDGTINFDAEQVNFEVTWNRPADYNIQTGLADPNSINKPPISRVYTARQCTSEFRQGTFTQTIDGLLFNMPKPDGSNKAATASMPEATNEGRQPPTTGDFARADRASAAASGASNPVLRSEPPAALPTKSQIYGSAPGRTTAQAPKDTLRTTPPPGAPTTATGESLAVADPFVPPDTLTTDQAGSSFDRLEAARLARLRGANPGQLIDQPGGAQLNTSQIMTWEP